MAESREIVTLREYVDIRFAAQEQAVSSALASADRAVSKAEAATEKRFENSNEWRNTVETLQRTYMPRTEFDQAVKGLSEKIEVLTERLNAKEARGRGMGDVWGWLVAIIAVIAAVVAIFRGHS